VNQKLGICLVCSLKIREAVRSIVRMIDWTSKEEILIYYRLIFVRYVVSALANVEIENYNFDAQAFRGYMIK